MDVTCWYCDGMRFRPDIQEGEDLWCPICNGEGVISAEEDARGTMPATYDVELTVIVTVEADDPEEAVTNAIESLSAIDFETASGVVLDGSRAPYRPDPVDAAEAEDERRTGWGVL